MISHIHNRVASFAVLVGLAAFAAGCDSVPLLAPSGSVITLISSVTALPVNGSTTIVAQVIEPAGTPPQRGTRVSFTTTLGRIEPVNAETDEGGQVIVRFLAGTGSGTATISAISGGASVASTNVLKILVGTAAVGSVRVSANPTLLPATGGSSTITAQALDINGNPLSSAPMSFSTTAGTIEQGFVTTDQSGTAETILRTSSQATVTAAVGAQAGSSTPPSTGTPGTPTTPATSGQASGTVTVNVSGAPTLIITPPTTAPSAGLPASFTFAVTASTTNGSAIREVTVNWGDGQSQNLGALTGTVAVSHIYQNAGTFPIVGTVTDSFGNVIRNSTSVTINAKPQPVVSLTTSTTNPTAGTDMTFTASVAPAASSGTVIQDVTINFGEPGAPTTHLGAVTGTSIPLHHVYASSGTYTVTLSATDSNGGVGTAVTQVFVQPAPPLSVSVSATPSSSGVNTTESFTATVTGLGNAVVQNYHWDFCGVPPKAGCTNGSADTTSNQQVRSYAAGSGPITVNVTITTSDARTASGQTVINP